MNVRFSVHLASVVGRRKTESHLAAELDTGLHAANAVSVHPLVLQYLSSRERTFARTDIHSHEHSPARAVARTSDSGCCSSGSMAQ